MRTGRPPRLTGVRATSWRLDGDTLAGLEQLAGELGVSRAEVVRVLVRAEIERRYLRGDTSPRLPPP